MRENMNKDLNYFNPMKLREKYSVKKSTGNNYSSFWLDNDWDTASSWDNEDDKPKGPDLIALASYRRAIANFVNIVTSKNIPVTFTSQGDSFTDGKKVTISAKLDDKLFDSAVGLALHEGSHILLSDFDFVRQLDVNIPKEYIDRGFSKGYSKNDVMVHIKNLLNFVEDRRIDYHIFSNAPGYKGYYHTMYDKYFRAKVVDKGLLSDEYTDENLDSYFFRIINITNSNTRLDSLNGLREIWNVLNIKNVSRLKNTEDAFNTALDIYNVVLNNLPDGIEKTNEDTIVVSNPGTGKTFTLALKVMELLQSHVEPEDILCITFTEKAQKEMFEKISSLAKERKIPISKILKIKIHTFHSFALQYLKEVGLISGNIIGNNFLRFSILESFVANQALNYPKGYIISDIVPKVENAIRYMKNFGITPDKIDLDDAKDELEKLHDESRSSFTMSEMKAFLRYFVKAYKHYEDSKAHNADADFTDILLMFVEKFHGAKIPYVLVDEMQDMNKTEAEMVKRIVGKRLFLVGDAKQAIFGFQGGSIKNFQDFSKTVLFFSARQLMIMLQM